MTRETFSLLDRGAGVRLAGAIVAVIAVWLLVMWALS